MREQNALPQKSCQTKRKTAKDDVDNVGAGRFGNVFRQTFDNFFYFIKKPCKKAGDMLY